MKKVIILGASSGIGRELALWYIRAGWSVGIAARRLELLEELKALAPERVSVARIDLVEEGVAERLDELITSLGGLDLYIHSSGVGWQNIALDAKLDETTLLVNAVGFARAVNYVFEYFARQGYGQLVAISSVAGTRGLGSAVSYSASKAYQARHLQGLRQLLAIRGLKDIHITDIRPGFVDTELLSGKRFPMLMRPDKVARQIVRSLEQRRSVRIIDWRYRLLIGLWRLIPRPLWERLPIK